MEVLLSITMDEPLYRCLMAHLFPGDGDEHGAVIAAGIVSTGRGTRLLARDLIIAKDGIDYVPGKYGYRALTAAFVARAARYCAENSLCYLAVHCHGGTSSVSFSGVDMQSHERGYPALLDITKGGPVGALVFAENAVAGDIWTQERRLTVHHATVVGSRVFNIYPSRQDRRVRIDQTYDRQARLFGDVGQEILFGLKIGIIGMGGAGSLINEWLSRLGVGHIVAIDYDKADPTNHPRLVGATPRDSRAWLQSSPLKLLRSLGRLTSTYKVDIGRRVARTAMPRMRYDGIVGNIVDIDTAMKLVDCDFIFLAADSMQSRLVFNALVHQYLIPGVQVGVKIPVDQATGEIGEIVANTRFVLPHPLGGCLKCHELISSDMLQDESYSDDDRRRQRYVDSDDVVAPSVITMNAVSSAPAVNDFMLMFTGLLNDEVRLRHRKNYPRRRVVKYTDGVEKSACTHCGFEHRSIRGRGDRASLPCREKR